MGRIATVLGFIAALALSMAMLVPAVLDWSHLRGDFEARASARLGVPVSIHGGMGLQVLPALVVTARDVRFDLPEAAGAVRIDEVAAELGWQGLWTGDAPVRGLTLGDPRITVADGAAWPDGWLEALGARGALPERVTVHDGQLRNAQDIKLARRLDADYRQVDGELRASFEAVVREQPLRGDMVLRAGDNAGPRPARLRLTLENAGTSLRFTGTAPRDGLWPLAGDWTLKASRLDALSALGPLASAGVTDPADEGDPDQLSGTAALFAPLLAKPVEMTLQARLTADGLEGGAVEALLGSHRFTGTVRADWAAGAPDLTADLKTQTLTIDQLAALDRAAPQASAGQALVALARALMPRRVPLPEDLTADLTVTVSSLLWNETVVQDVILGLSAREGLAGLARLGADMPGSVEVDLAGRPDRQNGAPVWLAGLRVNAAHPRAFLDWLGAPVERAGPGSFGEIGLTASLRLTPEDVIFDEIDLQAGDAQASGRIAAALGETVGLDIRAHLAGLDIDRLRPLIEERTGPIRITPLLLSNPRHWAADWPGDLAVEASLSMDRLTVGGRMIETARLAGAVSSDGAEIDAFETLDAKGVRVTGTAMVPAPALGDLRARFTAALEAPSPSALPGLRLWYGDGQDSVSAPLAVTMTGETVADTLTAELTGTAGRAEVEGAASVGYGTDGAVETSAVTLDVTCADGTVLAGLLGLDARMPQAVETDLDMPADGTLRARLTLEGGRGEGQVVLRTPQAEGSLLATLVREGTFWRSSGDLRIDAPDARTLGFPDWIHGLVSIETGFENTRTRLVLPTIGMRIGATSLHGDLRLDRSVPESEGETPVRPKLSGSLDIGMLMVPPLSAAPVPGDAAETGDLVSFLPPWPARSLPLAWIETWDADVIVSVESLNIGTLPIDKIRMPIRLGAAGLTIAPVTGTLSGGKITGSLMAEPARNGMAASLDLVLDGARGDAPVPLPDDGLIGQMRLAGDARAAVTSQGGSVFDLMANLNGTVDLDLDTVYLAPLDLDALAAAWPDLDSLSRFEAILTDAAAAGVTRIGDLQGAAVIEQGVATVKTLTGGTPQGPVAVTGALNLAAFMADLDMAFTVAQTHDPLHLQVSGPLDDPVRRLDAADLRYALALKIKRTKPGRISEDDLPPELLNLLEVLDEDGSADQP